MHSILGDHFENAASLASSLEEWCRGYRYDAEIRGDRLEIRLPDRPALDWPAPKRRLSLNRRAAVIGYEQTATAALDFVRSTAAVRVFYDIGADAGYFGFLGAALQPDPIETHCFEMRPGAVAGIEALAAKYQLGDLHAHLSGMSDHHEGPKQIWLSVTKMFESEPDEKAYRDPWLWRLKFRLKGRPDRDRLWQTTVEIDSIDDFTRRNGKPPGLIKIDVDGYEAKVLPGGMHTFRECRPVIFLELHKSRFFAHHGVTRPGIVAPLFELGYECLFFTNHHRLDLNSVAPVGPDSPELSREETDFMIFV